VRESALDRGVEVDSAGVEVLVQVQVDRQAALLGGGEQ